MSKETIYNLIYGIRRNYPDNASTFSKCFDKSCNNYGRGGGLCAHCSTKELGKAIDDMDLAEEYRVAIENAQKLRAEVIERWKGDK